MKRSFLILFAYTLLMSCSTTKNSYLSKGFVKKWNQLTLKSIKEQRSSVNDTTFKNELYSTKMFLTTPMLATDGRTETSLRMKFLETISSGLTYQPQSFFVVEFVERGERIRIKNLHVVNNQDLSKITYYEYLGDSWHVVSDTTIKKIDLHKELVSSAQPKGRINLGLEFLILTEFNSGNITSRYYRRYTVDESNALYHLLIEK